jgi:hypothetical protein
MKKVHFLANKTDIVNYSLTPLRYNKKALAERGYKIKIFYTPTIKAMTCDILCLISKPVLNMVGEKEPVCRELGPTIAFIIKTRKYAGKIIWMDDSDSTGVTHFELLPFVDLYLKKQLLKDKSLYRKEFYGGRIFTDYYNKRFKIEDSLPFNQFFPLDIEMSHKVSLSWNVGLGEVYDSFSRKGSFRRRVADYLPVIYNIPFTKPTEERDVDFFLKASANHARKTIAFHRQKTIRRLNGLVNKETSIVGFARDKFKSSEGCDDIFSPLKRGMVSLKTYRSFMKRSKIVPDPFSWGDINLKSYEAFIYGNLLLKPDISYLETWPALFVEGETYQPFSWDFEDLESIVLDLLHDDKKRIRIASNGQEAYRNAISPAGMERFCDWFVQQIEK